MEFDFKPWKIEVDIEETKKYYATNDDCLEKEVNRKFIDILTEQQISFFERLGVDIERVKIEYHDLQGDITLHIGKKEAYDVSFLLCGKLLSITPFQAEVYCDEENFGASVLDVTEIIDMQESMNAIGTMPYSFKHPMTAFPEKGLETWNCGFVCGKVIMKV